MEHTKVEGLAISRHALPEDTPPAARVLLLHGMGEHSGRHANLSQFLSGQGIEVVRFDFRGNGQSDGRKMWVDRFEDYVDDVHKVRGWIDRELAPAPLIIFGHSLGATTALHYIATKPHNARGLILSAPGFRIGKGVSRFKIGLAKALARILPKLSVQGVLDLGALSRDPQIAPAYKADPLCNRSNTVRQGNEILGALKRVPQMAAAIKIPTLIVHGSADAICPIEGSRELLEKLGSQEKSLKVFDGGYHELHNDLCKDECFDFVLKWIRGTLQ